MRSTNKIMQLHNTKIQHRANIDNREIRESIGDLSGSALKLFMYFKQLSDGWVYNPDEVSSTLGLSLLTVQRAKKELIEKEYLFIDHEKRRDDYYIGIRPVQKFKKQFGVEA